MTISTLKPYVIIATKGRGDEVRVLLQCLLSQTVTPERIIFVGTDEKDFGGLDISSNDVEIDCLISPLQGLPIQRNWGLERVIQLQGKKDDFITIYFDDDFRPKQDWIENAVACFSEQNIVGLTGEVLADGINGPGISEDIALEYLSGDLPPTSHWTHKFHDKDVESTYGCNMAFSAEVSRSLRFDKNLPAYGWLEDKDYSLRSKKLGRLICTTKCQGVHLGSKRGRVTQVKLGYSQIANPIYLMRKGSLSYYEALYLATANFIANHVKFFFPEDWVDRRGRVKGNWIAILDLFKGKIFPLRINDL